MRKLIWAFIIVLGLLLFPIQALAVDYNIEHTEINAFLLDDGNVEVSEVHTYQFDGKFNGISRALIPKEGTAIEDFQATENNTELKVEREKNLYKVYRSGRDEAITVQLTYVIENGVEVYEDVAQFAWPFFDSNNESDYEQLDLFIHPPKRTAEVTAFGYDAAWDTEVVDQSGVVHFNMGYVNGGENGDIRVVYHSDLFPNAPLAEGKLTHDDVLAEREKIEQEMADFNQRQNNLGTIAPYVIGVFVLYLFALLWSAWRERNNTKFEAEHRFTTSFLVPELEVSMPATIQYMNHGLLEVSAITAALFDLIRKGIVTQDEEEKFTLGTKQVDYSHENKLIHWLFYKIGEDGTFCSKDVTEYTDKKSNHSTYQQDFDEWKKEVSEEVKSQGLYKNKSKFKWIVGLSSLILIPFIMMFGVHHLFFQMAVAIVLFICILLFSLLYQPRTVKGVKIKQQWDQLMDGFSRIELEEWSELKDDEQMRAFIYSLGRNEKNMIEKSKTLATQMPSQASLSSNISLYILMASSTNNEFSSAHSASTTSTSGGSIGAGGGTGVGGGGGGSGAF